MFTWYHAWIANSKSPRRLRIADVNSSHGNMAIDCSQLLVFLADDSNNKQQQQ